MNPRIPEQLDKILALADSGHEGEAAAAVRKARQMLSRDGLSFGDLARVASSRFPLTRPSGLFSLFTAPRDDAADTDIIHLRQQLDDLRAQLQTQDLQLDFWRRRARDLEQTNSQAHHEAEKWKKLARDTAERLWDVGNQIAQDGDPESQKIL